MYTRTVMELNGENVIHVHNTNMEIILIGLHELVRR